MRKTLEDAQETHKKYAGKKTLSAKLPFLKQKEVYLFTKFLQSRQSKKLGPKYISPFPISWLINPVILQLKRPKKPQTHHPVFYFSLLNSVAISPLRPATNPLPTPTLIEGEQHSEIKDIDSGLHRGKLQYLILWKDFSHSETDWVDAQHMQAPCHFTKFHGKYPNKPHWKNLLTICFVFSFSPS